MIKVDLFEGELNIWLDDPPEFNVEPGRFLNYKVSTCASPKHDVRRGAVELTRHTGPIILYGLLAATYYPVNSDTLEIIIPVVDKYIPHTGEFSKSFDEVYLGLVEEYSSGIVKGIMDSGELLRPGKIYFDYALHGKIGSSIRVFRQLTLMLTHILMLDSLTQEKLHEVVRTILKNS